MEVSQAGFLAAYQYMEQQMERGSILRIETVRILNIGVHNLLGLIGRIRSAMMRCCISINLLD